MAIRDQSGEHKSSDYVTHAGITVIVPRNQGHGAVCIE